MSFTHSVSVGLSSCLMSEVSPGFSLLSLSAFLLLLPPYFLLSLVHCLQCMCVLCAIIIILKV